MHGGFDAEAISGLVGSLAGNPVVAWALVVAVAAFSGVAYALTARAEKNTTPVVAACYNSLQPVIALLVLGALGEAPGARNLTGSFLIVAGGFAAVALSTNDRRRWRRRLDNDLSSASWDKSKSEDGSRRGRTVRGGVGTERGDERIAARGGTEIRRQVRRALADAEANQSAKATPERGGTVRIVRPRADETREPTRLAPMLWTAAWALSMSVCALAGGGLITWSLVWVYWKLLL